MLIKDAFLLALLTHELDSLCTMTTIAHMLPTSMPQEIKQFILSEQLDKTKGFVHVLVYGILTKANLGQDHFKNNLKGSCDILYTKIYSLITNMKSPNPSLQNILSRRRRPLALRDQVGKTLVITMKPLSFIKYKTEVRLSDYFFQVPFQFNINFTFLPVRQRKDQCNFIFCFEIGNYESYGYHCDLLTNNFIPWSVLKKNKIYFRMKVTFLYSHENNCSLDLVNLIYHPINTLFYNQYVDWEDAYAYIPSEDATSCIISTALPLLQSIRYLHHDFNISFVSTLHILVQLDKRIVIKQTNKMFNGSSLFVFDGPGIISEELTTESNQREYKASTFQVYVMNMASNQYCAIEMTGYEAFWCNDEFEVKYEAEEIKLNHREMNDGKILFSWKHQDDNNVKTCQFQSYITNCNLHINSQNTVIINITKLITSSQTSFSEYYIQYSKSNLGNLMLTEVTGEFCHYGVFAVGYWSLVKGQKLKYDIVPICTISSDSLSTSVWLSSLYKANIFMFSYNPYQKIKVEFKIITSTCQVISIKPCVVLETKWINDIIRGGIHLTYKGAGMFTISMANTACVYIQIFQRYQETEICNTKFKLDVASFHLHDITSEGYMFLDFFHPSHRKSPPMYATLGNRNVSFETAKYFSMKVSSLYSEMYISFQRVHILKLLSCMIIKETNRAIITIPKKENLTVPYSIIKRVINLMSKAPSTCFKVVFENGPNLKKGKVQVTIRATYHRDIYAYFPNTDLQSPVLKDGSCAYGLIYDYYDCHKDIDIETFYVEKVINLNYFVPLYIDADSWTAYAHQDSNQKLFSKLFTDSLFTLSKADLDLNLSVTLQNLKSGTDGVCYNKMVHNNDPFKDKFIIQQSMVYYLHYKYILFSKVREQLRSSYLCSSPDTCRILEPNEPDLVSWEEADYHCRLQNMTLLTIGSKEEELHAVSLQTSVSKGGWRYEKQLIYLGLHNKVRTELYQTIKVK